VQKVRVLPVGSKEDGTNSLVTEDVFFPESKRNKAEAVFAARKDTDKFVDYEFKVYKGGQPLALVIMGLSEC
jgi:hypothetical protein